MLLDQLLQNHGLCSSVEDQSFASGETNAAAVFTQPRMVCVSYFGASDDSALVKYVIRCLRRILPDAKFVAAYWSSTNDALKNAEWREPVGA